MAKLEKILKEKCFANPKLIWPVFYVRFIDDGFGITKGSRQDVEYWIAEFNKLVQSIIIDKYTYGTQVAFMDLFIYKSDRFRKYGKFDINIFKRHRTNTTTYLRSLITGSTPSKIMYSMSLDDM